MAEIDFADGFDVPEPLAWGLTPVQLGAVVTGALLAYLALRSPLPRAAATAIAVVVAATGLALALIRREGRTLISWTSVAVRFWTRPRRGLLVVEGSGGRAGTMPFERAGWGDGQPIRREVPAIRASWEAATEMVETSRRIPLVLLPEPVGLPPRGDAAGAGPLRDADGAVHDLHTVIEASRPTTVARRATRRITFFSLSGGTGRTTLAVELAGLLADDDLGGDAWGMLTPPRVALVDLNLMSPRAGIRLGVPTATGWDLGEDGPIAAAVGRLLAAHGSGLRVLPGPSRLLPPGSADSPDLVGRVAAAVAELERGGCDTVVLDVAGDLSALTRWALESAHDIFVVLTPTAGGVHDAYRSTEALRTLGLGRRLRYVVNRGAGDPLVAEAMLDLGGAVVAEIPDDPALERAEMEHRLLGREGTGLTAAALRALAATVDARFLAPGSAVPPAARRIVRRRAG